MEPTSSTGAQIAGRTDTATSDETVGTCTIAASLSRRLARQALPARSAIVISGAEHVGRAVGSAARGRSAGAGVRAAGGASLRADGRKHAGSVLCARKSHGAAVAEVARAAAGLIATEAIGTMRGCAIVR